ncbi:polysaccharide biosynthesis protein [Defluviimonas sp. WL0075]|uniref:Polysaccharide biosynthesis protein n=1 Tax=Albidovulum sediminicola TaxID=2984331 RepID=A0ABT2Z2E0_9RHOB|nr:polysaccharide biosynthesis protein [Defluviimonas sp. WL0075]MCV2865292.1 polysaccharide biosynthesis protein [Defluviimonas sp. WL0075]
MQQAERSKAFPSRWNGRLAEAAALVLALGAGIAPAALLCAPVVLAGILLAQEEGAATQGRRRAAGVAILWMAAPLWTIAFPALSGGETGTTALIYAALCLLLVKAAPAPRSCAAIDAEAILRRPARSLVPPPVAAFAGRNLLVTGAGGSIGSEICRQLMILRPARLVLFEQSEAALYEVDRALRAMPGAAAVRIVPVLGSVADEAAALRALRENAIDIVLHAAAYKHVPMVQANPRAGLATNTLGTLTMARAAQAAGVGRFVLISTDKAVRPEGALGVSKQLAEQAVLDLASRPGPTCFSVVRFGNVFGSSGSVVPLFLEQIARGRPVTLTDPAATRYFMTVQEAVGLVLCAAGIARGGEVFVLDMGAPIAIGELARRLIAAAAPEGADVPIRVTGLRPGEKLHEDLACSGALEPTSVPGLFTALAPVPSQIEVAATFRALRRALAGDDEAAQDFVRRWLEAQATEARVGRDVSRQQVLP